MKVPAALTRIVAASLLLGSSAHATGQYNVVHYFTESAYTPTAGLVADSAGNLYGTTYSSSADSCGEDGCGTVFKLTRESGGGWKYTVIHRFHLSDGAGPNSKLTFDSAGNLYGTCGSGGASNTGTVFELSPSGSEWKIKVLYSFGQPPDVVGPWGAPAFDAKGNLYGSANAGGAHDQGGIFELKHSSGQWKETVIHNFTGGSDGGVPGAVNLTSDSAGNLYGTTQAGGEYFNGVVYKLTPSSNGSWKEAVLYNFTGAADGSEPTSGVIFDAAGNLYGTASAGGVKACGVDSQDYCGTVFELKPSNGKWRFARLHAFDGSDGWTPLFGLVLGSSGNVYGTTMAGGDDNDGLVFKLSKSGDTWTETMLHVFDQRDGAAPGELMLGSQDELYGPTSIGGLGPQPGYGVVFGVRP
ncbi:MAG TPA: choice-of-anchor tandem repeat GloVer-containing protein [Terriglobales bacterium]|nr:choice-of-anchor tandem repeat GloVer-containing protein [Terriglobales bacterium]